MVYAQICGLFVFMDRKFQKKALSLDASIELLQKRGLVIHDLGKIKHFLTYIGYYRLMGYGRFFYVDGKENEPTFRSGTTFNDVLELYVFDREFRLLVLDAVERIEVAVRTVISNHMATSYENPQWFMDPECMLDTLKKGKSAKPGKKYKVQTLDDLIDKLKHDTQFYEKGGTSLIFRNYYKYTDRPDLPASWMLTEGLSLGRWTFIFGFIRSFKDKKKIAQYFNLNAELLRSWLKALTYLRNLAAHHSMVCYRHFHIPPEIPKKINPVIKEHFEKSHPFVYQHCLMMEYFLKVISPDSSWAHQLMHLFETFPGVDAKKMGFPDNWQTTWKRPTFWRSA